MRPALLALLVCGCGSVAAIPLDDDRLSVDARQTLAGAADAVAVTRATVDIAQQDYRRALAWRTRFSTALAWPPAGADAAQTRAALADARVQMSELVRAGARRALVLERTKRDLVTARIAIRFDMARYDLDPLREDVGAARAELSAAHKAVHAHRDTVREAEQAWWQSYAAYLKAGGDPQVLWRP